MDPEFRNAHFIISIFEAGRLPPEDLPEIALAGRSNAGKSSLLNRLVGRKDLARVSSRPGRTQSLNFFKVNSKFYLVDLPGYGFAKAPLKARKRWQKLIEHYLENRNTLKLVISILDIRRDPDEQDLSLFEYLYHLKRPLLLVLNKVDKIPQPKRAKRIKEIKTFLPSWLKEPVVISAKTGEGIENLKEHIINIGKYWMPDKT